jgi:hypothetical protein
MRLKRPFGKRSKVWVVNGSGLQRIRGLTLCVFSQSDEPWPKLSTVGVSGLVVRREQLEPFLAIEPTSRLYLATFLICAIFDSRLESTGGKKLLKLIGDAEQSLNTGYFGIDVPDRKATLYSGGNTRFNTTNMSTVGRAVASLLTSPITSQSGASLSDYENGYVYISSFLTTQREILAACQRVSNTSTPSGKSKKTARCGGSRRAKNVWQRVIYMEE